MSKFSVGEKCEAYSRQHGTWEPCEIDALPGMLSAPGGGFYGIKANGRLWIIEESRLRKLHGDSEDPGLTRLKKLLLQDAPKPVKERA